MGDSVSIYIQEDDPGDTINAGALTALGTTVAVTGGTFSTGVTIGDNEADGSTPITDGDYYIFVVVGTPGATSAVAAKRMVTVEIKAEISSITVPDGSSPGHTDDDSAPDPFPGQRRRI